MTRSRYVKAPEPPPELQPLYEAVMKVLAREWTVTQAAQAVGLSRLRFQTRMHRGLNGLLEALADQPQGRKPMRESERLLREEVVALQKENHHLANQVNSTVRMMGLATEWMKKGLKSAGRQSGARPTEAPPANESEDDSGAAAQLEQVRELKVGVPAPLMVPKTAFWGTAPAEGGPWLPPGTTNLTPDRAGVPPVSRPASESENDKRAAVRLEHARELKVAGVSAPLAAAALGVSASTVRRWVARQHAGEVLVRRRGPSPSSALPGTATAKAIAVLEELKGCIGAAPLARVSGLSRRCAGRVKAEAKTRAECDRRAETTRVKVEPGVIRGFDAVMLGKLPVLVAADGAINYRTSVMPAVRYNQDAVAIALAADFEKNGAPLVLRLDRAKCHTAPKVRDVLTAHGVLVLQGPPHCPRYYGQLERQNREHRSWLDALGKLSMGQLGSECEQMRIAFNEVVPRRRLGWQTAGVVWRSCTMPNVNRRELAAEVEERKQRLEEDEAVRGGHPGMAERLAIEAALIKRGLLKLMKGGWC